MKANTVKYTTNYLLASFIIITQPTQMSRYVN